jgi:hypothetical protein
MQSVEQNTQEARLLTNSPVMGDEDELGDPSDVKLWLGKRRHILTFFVVSAVSAVSSSLQSLASAQ